jgi:hypothetical protein
MDINGRLHNVLLAVTSEDCNALLSFPTAGSHSGLERLTVRAEEIRPDSIQFVRFPWPVSPAFPGSQGFPSTICRSSWHISVSVV